MSLLSSSDIARARATLLQVANAHLTAIREAGARDRYGEETSDGDVTWAGSIPGFLEREQAVSVDAPQAERPSRARYTDRTTLTLLDADAGNGVADLIRAPWENTRVIVDDERVSPAVSAAYKVVDVVHESTPTLGSVTLILVPEPVVA